MTRFIMETFDGHISDGALNVFKSFSAAKLLNYARNSTFLSVRLVFAGFTKKQMVDSANQLLTFYEEDSEQYSLAKNLCNKLESLSIFPDYKISGELETKLIELKNHKIINFSIEDGDLYLYAPEFDVRDDYVGKVLLNILAESSEDVKSEIALLMLSCRQDDGVMADPDYIFNRDEIGSELVRTLTIGDYNQLLKFAYYDSKLYVKLGLEGKDRKDSVAINDENFENFSEDSKVNEFFLDGLTFLNKHSIGGALFSNTGASVN